jgi:hypothetical protein
VTAFWHDLMMRPRGRDPSDASDTQARRALEFSGNLGVFAGLAAMPDGRYAMGLADWEGGATGGVQVRNAAGQLDAAFGGDATIDGTPVNSVAAAWFPAGAGFVPLTPNRILDTRAPRRSATTWSCTEGARSVLPRPRAVPGPRNLPAIPAQYGRTLECAEGRSTHSRRVRQRARICRHDPHPRREPT